MDTQIDPNESVGTEPVPSPEDALLFHLAFKRVEAQVRAVSEDDLEPVNLEVPSTVATVAGAYPEIAARRAELEGLRGFDVTQVDRLRDFALALAHVHGEYRAAGGVVDNVGEIATECLAIRDRFHTDATALAKRKLLDETRVAKLRGGSSYRMIAFDVVGLVGLFLEKWDTISGKTAVDTAEVEQARRVASRLINALGVREQAAPVPNEVGALRQKAYTLLVRSYNDVRNALAFVRRAKGDVDEIAPSLYAGRGRRAPTEDASALAPTAVPEPPAELSAATTAPTGTTAIGVPVGFPGGSPLAGR